MAEVLDRSTLRRQAHAVVQSALRRGDLVKPSVCQECGRRPGRFLIRAHHVDHSAPLDVEWLCSKCHSGRNLEAYLSTLFPPAEWTRIVAKAKQEGGSLRAVLLGWLKKWVEEPD